MQLFPEFGQRDRIAQLLAEQGFGGPQGFQEPGGPPFSDTGPFPGMPPETPSPDYTGPQPVQMPPMGFPDDTIPPGVPQVGPAPFALDENWLRAYRGGGPGFPGQAMGDLAAGAGPPPLPTHSMQQQPGGMGPLPGAPPGGPEAAIPWWLMGLNGPGGAPVGA